MRTYSEITGRYLKQNKKRTILTITGIILAVSLFSGISTFFFGMRDWFLEHERRSSGNFEVLYRNVTDDKLDRITKNFEVLNYGISIEDAENVMAIKDHDNFSVGLNILDGNMLNNVKYFKLTEGEKPAVKGEILLDKRSKVKLKKSVGDYIELYNSKDVKKHIKPENKYKIVGFYDPKVISGDKDVPLSGVTYLSPDSINKNHKYTVYVNLKEKRNKRAIGKKVGESIGLSSKVHENPRDNEIDFNDNVLRVMAEGNNALLNDSMKNMLLFVTILIIVCTVAVIYNAFNISVAERINQFGILRSIGATPNKIRRIVFKEGFIMGAIAIPLGILAGYLGIYTTIKILGTSKSFIFGEMKVAFYPEIILISLVLTAITIILSVMGPARTASKVSPIDAIRNSSSLKKGKIKRRRAGLIKLLFGIEGAVAYKNIRRNNKRFLITIFSLMISLVMFVVFTSIGKVGRDMSSKLMFSYPFDATIQLRDSSGKDSIDKKVIDEIRNKEGIESLYTPKVVGGILYFDSSYVNKDYYKKIAEPEPEIEKINGKDYALMNNVKYSSYDKNSLELAKNDLEEGKIDIDELNKGGVLLINRNDISKNNGEKVISNITNYKVGDKIKIPKTKNVFHLMNEDGNTDIHKENKKTIENNEFIEVTVAGVLSRDSFGGNIRHSGIGLVFSEEYFNKEFGEMPNSIVAIKFKDSNARENLQNYLEDKAVEVDGSYMDIYNMKKENDSVMVQIAVFIYGFITLITIIGVVNIMNTITIGLLLRKSEFATLTAIGMTKQQLGKMVVLEGTLHGIITGILGSGVSYVLYKMMLKSSSGYLQYDPKFPIGVFISGFVGVILLTLIASLIPLRKLKNMSIVENIRARE